MGQEAGFNLQTVIEGIAGTISTYGLQVVGAIALLILGRIVAGIARSAIRRTLDRSRLDRTLVPFVANLVYYTLLAFVVVAVLSLFGIETTSFIAVLGAAGLAVGLALQGTLSNFSAGVMLLAFRPFKIGDYVEASGSAGTVIEIGIFSTTLHSPDNVRIVVPNSGVYGHVLKNYSANETRRNDLVIGISYSDDIGKAIATIQDLLNGEERVLKEPAPVIAVSELGDSSVNLVVRPWCHRDHYWPLRFELTRRMKEGLEAAGCSIPFPQRDVHLFRDEKEDAA
jgi:small conductance mechanosensitive channel